jgi:hypothetical protein
VAEADLAVQIALIWIAHIGVDRALGYGLSFSDVGVGSGLIAFGGLLGYRSLHEQA